MTPDALAELTAIQVGIDDLLAQRTSPLFAADAAIRNESGFSPRMSAQRRPRSYGAQRQSVGVRWQQGFSHRGCEAPGAAMAPPRSEV